MPDGITPPRLAVRLLERRLPSEIAGALLGDLEEEYRERRTRGASRLRADVWFWRQALTLRIGALRRAAKRLRVTRPSRKRDRAGTDRTGPDRIGGNPPRGGGGHRKGIQGLSWLDVKLGLRMLVKQPGLTLVAVFALAIGIPFGLLPMHAVDVLQAPPPFDEADRIKILSSFNTATSSLEAPTLYDFVHWRGELTSFQALGAMTSFSAYNVMSEDGRAAPVRGSEVTASTFEIVRVPPLLGRTLIPADEVIGAPDVVVVSYDLWQSRLEGDPDVVGRTIRIAGIPRDVVGVMPVGFLFPGRDQLWMPLQVNATTDEHGQGRAYRVFGRLASGVGVEEAEAELTTIGSRLAVEFPEAHARLRHEVVPFTIGLWGLGKGGMADGIAFYIYQLLALMILVVACANVAMLVFTRTTTRAGELAVRTALGASRVRVITQLFTEALVFAVLAAGVGLLIADWISTIRFELMNLLPYWIDVGVTPRTVAWALSLAVLSAGLVSVIPAIRVTGKAVQQNIQRAAASRSGMKFGGISSALIVADVALAVVTVGVGVGLSDALTESTDGMGIQADQFLSADLRIPELESGTEGPLCVESCSGTEDVTEFMERMGATQQALVERLGSEPGVRGVAVADALPGMQFQSRPVEVDGEVPSEDFAARTVLGARVDLDFFNAFEQPILRGRGFASSDLGEDGRAVIVNTFFVERVLGGRNPIGRRVRYAAAMHTEESPWYEIVGLVGPLGMDVFDSRLPGMYHPLAPGEIQRVRLAIHLGDDPESFTPRLWTLAAEVDPTAVIENPVALSEVRNLNTLLMVWIKLGGGIFVGILLALSISGIYALMSFTVGERTKEIGIRTALGALPNNIAFSVGRRTLVQLGVGILIGMPVAGLILFQLKALGRIQAHSPFLLTALVGVGVMALVGTLACTVPTLRALRIMPTEALREGG